MSISIKKSKGTAKLTYFDETKEIAIDIYEIRKKLKDTKI
jgi:hypothetical protein